MNRSPGAGCRYTSRMRKKAVPRSGHAEAAAGKTWGWHGQEQIGRRWTFFCR